MLEKRQIIEKINEKIKEDMVADTLVQALKHKYQRIYTHSVNVAVSAFFLAMKMELSEETCLSIGIAGMLHDIGKLNMPSSVLYKPGELTKQEQALIERHPSIGVSLLNQSSLLPKCAQGILYHHQRMDQKGYGVGLSGAAIPLEAQIIAVCNVFDSLVTYRLNQKKLSLKEACEVIERDVGNVFDITVGYAFLKVVGQVYENINGIKQGSAVPGNEIVTEKHAAFIDWEMMLD